MKARDYCHYCGKTGTRIKPIATLDFGVYRVGGLALPIGAVASCSSECSHAEFERRLGNAVLLQLPWQDRWHCQRRREALSQVGLEEPETVEEEAG